MNLNKLASISLIVLMSFVFTGCTLFDGFGRKDTQKTPTQTPQITISITDQNKVSQSYQINYLEGENLYETLNRFTTLYPQIYFEFDIRDLAEGIELFLSGMNGYKPNEEGKTWLMSINGVEINNPLNKIVPQGNDQITLEII